MIQAIQCPKCMSYRTYSKRMLRAAIGLLTIAFGTILLTLFLGILGFVAAWLMGIGMIVYAIVPSKRGNHICLQCGTSFSK